MVKSLAAIIALCVGCTTNIDYYVKEKDTGIQRDTHDTIYDTENTTGDTRDTIYDTGSKIKDTADTGCYDNIPPIITNVYANPASVSTLDTFFVSATITDNIAVTNASLTIDTITENLTDDDGDSIYVSPVISASSLGLGTHLIQINATDDTNSATNTDASIEVTQPVTCPYTCTSTICLYVDGTLEAELNTPYPSHMSSIDILRVGYGGQYVDNLILNVAGIPYVSEDFSVDRGCFNAGSVSGGIYISETEGNDCSFSPAFDATTEHWMVSIDVLAGSTPNFALRSSSYSAPGVNWDFAANGYINDGAGYSVPFTSGTPDTSRDHTIIMCNSTL